MILDGVDTFGDETGEGIVPSEVFKGDVVVLAFAEGL